MKRKIIQIISHTETPYDVFGGKCLPIERIFGLANDGTLWWHEVEGWMPADEGHNLDFDQRFDEELEPEGK